MNNIIKIINIIILIILVTGCGFKLQGKHQFPVNLQNLAMDLADHAPFKKLLQQSLQQNGVTVRDKFEKNIVLLEVNTPSINEQVYGYDSKGQVSQYRLTVSTNYKLFGIDGKVLLENTILRSRIYFVAPNQVLSNSGEQQIIVEELNIEIINELLRQLSLCC